MIIKNKIPWNSRLHCHWSHHYDCIQLNILIMDPPESHKINDDDFSAVNQWSYKIH